MDNRSQKNEIAESIPKTLTFKDLIFSLRSALTVQSFVLICLLGLASIYTLYFARAIFLPIVFAFLFKLLLSPVVNALKKIYIPQKLGAGIVILLLISIILYGFYNLTNPALDWIKKGPQMISQVEKKLTRFIEPIKKPFEQLSKINERVSELTSFKGTKEIAPTVEIRQPSVLPTIIASTGGGIVQLGITLTLLYFLLATGDDLLSSFIKFFSTLSKKKEIVTITRESERMVALYLLTTTCINISIGLLIMLLMYIYDVPNPMLWGVMAAILEFIPYLGVMIGTIVMALVAIVTFDSLFLIIAIPLSYYLSISIISGILAPFILGRQLLVHPVLVFLAIIAGGVMWGIPGILIAVPIAVIIKIVFENLNTTPRVEGN